MKAARVYFTHEFAMPTQSVVFPVIVKAFVPPPESQRLMEQAHFYVRVPLQLRVTPVAMYIPLPDGGCSLGADVLDFSSGWDVNGELDGKAHVGRDLMPLHGTCLDPAPPEVAAMITAAERCFCSLTYRKSASRFIPALHRASPDERDEWLARPKTLAVQTRLKLQIAFRWRGWAWKEMTLADCAAELTSLGMPIKAEALKKKAQSMELPSLRKMRE